MKLKSQVWFFRFDIAGFSCLVVLVWNSQDSLSVRFKIQKTFSENQFFTKSPSFWKIVNFRNNHTLHDFIDFWQMFKRLRIFTSFNVKLFVQIHNVKWFKTEGSKNVFIRILNDFGNCHAFFDFSSQTFHSNRFDSRKYRTNMNICSWSNVARNHEFQIKYIKKRAEQSEGFISGSFFYQ